MDKKRDCDKKMCMNFARVVSLNRNIQLTIASDTSEHTMTNACLGTPYPSSVDVDDVVKKAQPGSDEATSDGALPLIYTIGHSSHSVDHFLRALEGKNVARVYDVRCVPVSSANPQFDKTELQANVEAKGMEYVHTPEIGGSNHPTRTDIGVFFNLQNPAGPGANRLEEISQLSRGIGSRLRRRGNILLMCSCFKWDECHRQVLAQKLEKKNPGKVHHLKILRAGLLEDKAHPAKMKYDPELLKKQGGSKEDEGWQIARPEPEINLRDLILQPDKQDAGGAKTDTGATEVKPPGKKKRWGR